MGFKILYFSVYVSLFLNYTLCAFVRGCVCVCLCASVCACVHVSLCCTLIGLDRLGKVTSLPDCLGPPPPEVKEEGRTERLLLDAVKETDLLSSATIITPSPV